MPDKVIVTKSKLDALATSIATKSGASTPMTIAQMKTAVDNISGGGSSAGAGEYTLENISPSQSITTSGTVSSYATGGVISSYTERIQEGEWYLVTYDGDEYVLQCYLANTGEIVLGDVRVATTNTTLTYLSTPFIVEYNSTVPVYFLAARNTNTHTLKIDKFVWIEGGATVGTKIISSNGTYDPADDNLDLYSGVTVNIPSGSASTPATSITANPSISVSSSGLITATASASQSVTPTVSAGYVSSGTAGTVTVSGSNTSQLTTLGATTYNTSSTDQTITSGKYITGTQTIKAVTVSGLDASKILSGTTVKIGDANDDDRIASVSGSVTFSTIYTGSSAPSNGTGVNGDIYIKTS